MCGAAAESILLAIAIAKAGDEEGVLKEYLTRGGRQRIENRVVGPQPDWIRDQFRGCTGLLNYWRDSAAHGRHSDMQYAEAHTALSQLLWFAQFADDQWELLTATGGRA